MIDIAHDGKSACMIQALEGGEAKRFVIDEMIDHFPMQAPKVALQVQMPVFFYFRLLYSIKVRSFYGIGC